MECDVIQILIDFSFKSTKTQETQTGWLEDSVKLMAFLVTHFRVFVSQIHKVTKLAIQTVDLLLWSLKNAGDETKTNML
jgi:hypothetical protein